MGRRKTPGSVPVPFPLEKFEVRTENFPGVLGGRSRRDPCIPGRIELLASGPPLRPPRPDPRAGLGPAPTRGASDRRRPRRPRGRSGRRRRRDRPARSTQGNHRDRPGVGGPWRREGGGPHRPSGAVRTRPVVCRPSRARGPSTPGHWQCLSISWGSPGLLGPETKEADDGPDESLHPPRGRWPFIPMSPAGVPRPDSPGKTV